MATTGTTANALLPLARYLLHAACNPDVRTYVAQILLLRTVLGPGKGPTTSLAGNCNLPGGTASICQPYVNQRL